MLGLTFVQIHAVHRLIQHSTARPLCKTVHQCRTNISGAGDGVDDLGHAVKLIQTFWIFRLPAKEPNTRPLYPKTSSATFCRHWIFRLPAKEPNTRPLYPKTSREQLPLLLGFFNACTFVQAQVRH